jgi:tetratricopeptide (TPR) repeat protein
MKRPLLSITHPEEGVALHLYALILYKLKEYEAAEQLFKKYLIQNPESAVALVDLGFLLVDTGRFMDAQQFFKKAYQLSKEWNSLYGLALTYQNMGDCDKALSLWDQIMEKELLPGEWKDKVLKFINLCKKQVKK